MVDDVVALYVDPRGPYPGLVKQWYDEARNAEMYAGPHPVVAHPPCGPWGGLRHQSHNDDPRHALHAVEVVREFGGVLEHPAGSKLWGALGLPLPGDAPDSHGGHTLEVKQCEWGHPAKKKTWVYVVGVPAEQPDPPFPGRAPTHWVSGGRKRSRKGRGGVVPPGIKVCSAQQRLRTPPAFAAWLIELARSARAR